MEKMIMKKSISKILCVLFSAAIIFSALPAVHAEKAGEAEPSVEISVEYGNIRNASDTAGITVKVKNTSPETINNVYISVSSGSCLPAKGSKTCSEKKQVLDRGDTTEFRFNAVLGSKASGISFFDKIIMFFKRLFNSPGSFAALPDEVNKITNEKSQYEEEIKFGSASGKITVTVYYLYGYTASMEKENEKLDRTLKEVVEDYDGDNGYAGYIESELKRLEENGDISDYLHDKNTGEFWVNTKSDSGKIYSIPTAPDDDVLKMPEPQESEFEASKDGEGKIDNEVIILDCLNNSTVFTEMKNMELNTGRIKYFTLEDALALEKVPMVLFLTHGNVDWLGQPYICVMKDDSKREAENAALENRQAVEILGRKEGVKEIVEYLGLLPKFFTVNYKNQGYMFNGSVVYLGLCSGFGKNSTNEELADAFIESGCGYVIGFKDTVKETNNINFIKEFINQSIMSDNVGSFIDTLKTKYKATAKGSASGITFEKTTVYVEVYDSQAQIEKGIMNCSFVFTVPKDTDIVEIKKQAKNKAADKGCDTSMADFQENDISTGITADKGHYSMLLNLNLD